MIKKNVFENQIVEKNWKANYLYTLKANNKYQNNIKLSTGDNYYNNHKDNTNIVTE